MSDWLDRIISELDTRIEDDKPEITVEVVNDGETTHYLFQEGDDPHRAIVAESRAIMEVEP